MNDIRNKIDDILVELNQEIDNHSAGLGLYQSKDFEMMSRFTYESAGYYCWIKFGDEILWDSENEPRKWIEENDDYEDLTIFIKEEFNKYVSTVNKFTFSDVNNEHKLRNAADAADEIIHVLDERNIIDWNKFHSQTQDEIYDAIMGIVAKT